MDRSNENVETDHVEAARERSSGVTAWHDAELKVSETAAGPAFMVANAHRHVRELRAALRRERMRGRTGHWTYDLGRHLSLARQLRQAEAAMDEPRGRRSRVQLAPEAS